MAFGSAAHVFLFEAIDALANRGFDFSLRFHGAIEFRLESSGRSNGNSATLAG